VSSSIAIIGTKLGMCTQYDRNGSIVPLTLVHVEENVLLGVRSKKRDGYNAIILAGGKILKNRRTNSTKMPQLGQFKSRNLEPRSVIKEFRINFLLDGCADGSDLLRFGVGDYMVNMFVDVTATTKGKGFQGAMKRHGFAGLEASHGVSVSHRSHGSTGQRQDPGKVFKGKKMAGHMGDVVVTLQSLRIYFIDIERKIVAIRGSIPGSVGCSVLISDAVKKVSNKVHKSAINGVEISSMVKVACGG